MKVNFIKSLEIMINMCTGAVTVPLLIRIYRGIRERNCMQMQHGAFCDHFVPNWGANYAHK